MKKGKIVLGLCGFCLLLSSCGSSQNATVGNNTDPNNHSVSTTSMSRETSDIQYLKKDLENGTVSIWYFETSTPQDTIAIPEEINGKTVSQIGERLFEGNEEVKTVILPKTVRAIGNSAFNFATTLEKVEISGPVEILENSSFYGCDSLQELNFPDGLKKIGDHAITACSSLTDLYLPGTVEEIEQSAKLLLYKGVRNVVVTLGARGSLIVNQNGALLVPARKVSAVDTTGAGDCFNGVLAVALSAGMPLEKAVLRANLAASISVTRRGALTSMPTLEDLESLWQMFSRDDMSYVAEG